MAYSVLGFTVPIFDPLYPYFSTTFNIGYDKIGMVFFGGSLVAIISNIIAGRICDRYPFRRVMLCSFLITFLGFAFFAIYQNFLSLIVTVLIVNIGYNFVWPGSYSAVFNDFSENYSEIYVNLDKFYYLSTLFGPLFISLLFYLNLSPRFIFIILSIVFGIIFIVFYFNFKIPFYKDNPESKTDIDIALSKGQYIEEKPLENGILVNEELESSYTYKGFRTILKKVTVLTGVILTLFSCIMVGSSAWLTTYFTYFDVPIFVSSIFVSVYWFFTFIGLQIISKMLNYFSEAKILFFGGLLSSAGLFFYGIVPNIYIKIIFIAMIAIGVSGIYPLGAAIAVRENPQTSATASGFMVAMGIAGSLIAQPLMGFTSEYLDKIYIPFVLLAIALLGTFISFILLKHLKEPVFCS
jgi:MFS family permease